MPVKVNVYKYSTVLLAILLVIVIASFWSYDLGYKSGKSSNLTTSSPVTSIQYTTVPTTNMQSTGCSYTQPTQVPVGGNLTCGLFITTIANVSNASIGLRASYNGTHIIKIVNKSVMNRGTFALNFPSVTVYARIWSFSVPMQTVYIQMAAGASTLTTTVTLPSTSYNTTTTTSVNTTSTSTIYPTTTK